jgi:serine/threonine protein kinase
LPLSDLIEIAARMVHAVADLHRQHVIHLDLKPENFLQRKTGEMVLVDYGLSRHDQLPDLLAEEFTIPMGTYPYIAPEQYLRCRDDPRSDLFALGAMLYALATGRNPWGTPETLRGVSKRLVARSGAAARDPARNPGVAAGNHPAGAGASIRCGAIRRRRRWRLTCRHPQQVTLTARALKLKRDGWLQVFDRWRVMRKIRRFEAPKLGGGAVGIDSGHRGGGGPVAAGRAAGRLACGR